MLRSGLPPARHVAGTDPWQTARPRHACVARAQKACFPAARSSSSLRYRRNGAPRTAATESIACGQRAGGDTDSVLEAISAPSATTRTRPTNTMAVNNEARATSRGITRGRKRRCGARVPARAAWRPPNDKLELRVNQNRLGALNWNNVPRTPDCPRAASGRARARSGEATTPPTTGTVRASRSPRAPERRTRADGKRKTAVRSV